MATATSVMPSSTSLRRDRQADPQTPNPALTPRRAGRSGEVAVTLRPPINDTTSWLRSVVPAVDHVAPLARVPAPPDGEILAVARARRSVGLHGVNLRFADGEAQVAADRDIPRHGPPEDSSLRREVGDEVAPNRVRSVDDPRLPREDRAVGRRVGRERAAPPGPSGPVMPPNP